MGRRGKKRKREVRGIDSLMHSETLLAASDVSPELLPCSFEVGAVELEE